MAKILPFPKPTKVVTVSTAGGFTVTLDPKAIAKALEQDPRKP